MGAKRNNAVLSWITHFAERPYLLLYLRLERFDLKSRRIALFPEFEYLSLWGVFPICSLGSCERL